MSQRFVSRLTTAALAVGAIFMATGPVLAQRPRPERLTVPETR
jgi:hypothetical protein